MAKVVGDIAVRVGADIAPLQKNMRRATKSTNRFANSGAASAAKFAKVIAGVGVAAAAMAVKVGAASRKAISALDAIGKKAAQIGTSAESLQRLAFAAESAGVSNQKLESSLERFVKRLGEAEQGFGAAKKQLDALGLSADELANMPLDDALAVVADRMADIESPTQRAAAAAGLFGREGVAMVNMLGQGSEAMRETMRAAEDFGAVVSNETVAAAEDLEDMLGRLGAGIRGELNEALVEVGPLLVGAARFALTLARAFGEVVDFIGDAYEATDEYLNPLNDAERATREVVNAMADEIDQTRILDAALKEGGRMSAAMAAQKLAEAKARFENVRAIIAEHQAEVSGSAALQDVNRRMSQAIEMRDALAGPGADADTLPVTMREQYEALDQSVAALMERQARLVEVPEQLAEQLERSRENVERLDGALQNVVGGFVNFGGGSEQEPIRTDLGEDGTSRSGGGGPARSDDQVSTLDRLLGLDPESVELREARMETALERQKTFIENVRAVMQQARDGEINISAQQYQRLEELEAQHQQKMRMLRLKGVSTAIGATSDLFAAMASVSKSGGERVLKISQALSAAQGLINSYLAYTEMLKDPSFVGNPAARFAAGASILASGLKMVSAIKGVSAGGGSSGSGGGGGGSSAGASAQAAQQAQSTPVQQLRVEVVGEGAGADAAFRTLQLVQEAIDNGGRIDGIVADRVGV